MNIFNPSNPYIGHHGIDNFLKSIDWDGALNCDLYELNNKIRKIIELKDKSRRKYQGYYDGVVYNLKIIADTKPNSRKRVSRRDHILRDHAFCRVLELVENLDIISLKEKALIALKKSKDFEPVYSNDGFIVSIREKSDG